ncbi:class I SAM-dependent methyltransferase [Paenibacillus sp. 481]|uniref:class I SAM-dependent methyltransferase n=1 Tax=Paenibacillus sp. 481 TaxID=2835869 RepID=UPI001E5B5663|nr:class I SAM-dependent methyltransferase [Paenibacillus sp. 481]UHA72781.1 class I SAM-dependent methyltransferase [Paenibacillus sp. 481]
MGAEKRANVQAERVVEQAEQAERADQVGDLLQQTFDELVQESEQSFSGWDFSYLSKHGRMAEFPLPWNYASVLIPYISKAQSMLDMGTGGGEFLQLLSERCPLPLRTEATEGYKPNVAVAQHNLSSLGVKVHYFEDDASLPFADAAFDLITNRHESFDANELYRMMKPGGVFITQQVGGDNDQEFNRALGAPEVEHYDWTCDKAEQQLRAAGFTVLKRADESTWSRFYDIGAIIYYLRAIPWQIEDFTVEAYKEGLLKLHQQVQDQGYVEVTCHRFLLIVKK